MTDETPLKYSLKVSVGFNEKGFFTLLITKVTSGFAISEIKHSVSWRVLITGSSTMHTPDAKLAEDREAFYGDVVLGKIINMDPPVGIGSFNLTTNVY